MASSNDKKGNLCMSDFGRPIAKYGKKIISICANQEEIDSNDVHVVDKIKIPKGPIKLQQVPDSTRERDILYITGPSGSGKSTYVVNYLREYKLKYKNNPIYVLSSLKEDETLDKIKGLKRIKLDEKMHQEPLTAEMFQDCCIIADDVDVIADKKIREAVLTLVNQVLEIGRHFRTTLIMTNHLATAGKDTRRILNEAHTVTYFPHSGSSHGIKYLMEEYCGITKPDMMKAKRSGSRWCTIFKNYPTCILTEFEAWQPDMDD
jgi:adenylylsulfate kinase-like enzyme